MTVRSTLVVLTGLGLLLTPRNLCAQVANELPVEWADNPHCTRPSTLDAEVRHLLGTGTEAPSGWRFVIELSADAEHGSPNLELLLRVNTPETQRQRRIAVTGCVEAARTAAVLIAVAIDPTVVPPVTATLTTTNEVPATAVAVTTEAPSDNHETKSAEANDGTSWGLGASLGIDVARLPKPSLDVTLRGVARAPHLRFELLASWLPTAAEDVPERQQASLDLWAASIATRACVLADLWNVRVGPCALARIGMLHGNASGVDRNAPTTTWLLSTGLAGVIEWPLSQQLAIDLIWGGELSLVRPTFRVQGSSASHTLAALSTQVGVGVLAVFE